jgi:phosphate transport system substrate-binding protein
VQPVSREEGSGTREAFELLVMLDERVSPMAVVVPSSESVVEYVAVHPQAIGYVSQGHVTPSVKVLAIEGELPSASTAGQGIYPITREFWLVTAEPPSTEVEDFVRFVVGPIGQQIVGRRYGRVR